MSSNNRLQQDGAAVRMITEYLSKRTRPTPAALMCNHSNQIDNITSHVISYLVLHLACHASSLIAVPTLIVNLDPNLSENIHPSTY